MVLETVWMSVEGVHSLVDGLWVVRLVIQLHALGVSLNKPLISFVKRLALPSPTANPGNIIPHFASMQNPKFQKCSAMHGMSACTLCSRLRKNRSYDEI